MILTYPQQDGTHRILYFTAFPVLIQVAVTACYRQIRVIAAGLTCGKGFLQLRYMFQIV